MVTIQVKNIEGKSVLPVAGSKLAAGYDVIAVDDPIVVGDGVTKEGDFFPLYKRIDYLEYHTALHISPQASEQFTHHNREFYHTLIHPRSSVRKYNLVLANSIGLVDNDYRGEIILCFKYIWQPEDFVILLNPNMTITDGGSIDKINDTTAKLKVDILGKLNREKIYKKGDKIGQLVVSQTNPAEFNFVNELDATVRGEGGFGSTDVKESTASGELKAFETLINNPVMDNIYKVVRKAQTTSTEEDKPKTKEIFGSIAERYQKSGGIPIKKKYTDEIKERDQQI